jgi:surface protein
MFAGVTNFSTTIGDITGWDTGCITNMSQLFASSDFNEDIGAWDTGNVTDMSGVFSSASAFDQDISGWDTSKVVSMAGMFANSVFNQPLNSWDVRNVTDMYGMFYENHVFNQPLNSWNTSKVTRVTASGYGMFYNAIAFDQNIGAWDTSNITSMINMFVGVNMSSVNYDALLNGWSSRPQHIISFYAGDSQYSSAGLVGRNILTGTYNWTIYDGGLNSSPCMGVVCNDTCSGDYRLVNGTCFVNGTSYFCAYDSLLCSNGCSGGICIVTSCNDTDRATYPTINYTLRGTMSATGITNRTDYCNGNNVLEYYCDNSTSYHPVPVQYDCTTIGMNCVNGSCTAVSSNGTCDDSDSLIYPTINYNLSGVVTINNGTELTYTDFCYSGDHLLEYYCGSPTIPLVTNTSYWCGSVGKICQIGTGQCMVNTTNVTNCSAYSDSYAYPTIWMESFGYTDALTNHGGWIGYPYVIGENPYDTCNVLFMDANISTDPVANVLNSTISTDFVLTFDIQPETDIGGNMYVLGGMPFYVFLLNATGDELNPTIELEWGTDGKIYNHPHNASIQEIGNYQGSSDSYKLVVNMTTHTFKFYYTNSTNLLSFIEGCSNCSFKNNGTIRQFEIYPLPPVYGNWTYNILGIWADNIKLTLGAETAPPVNVTNYCYFTGCIFHDHFLYADDTYTHGWYMFNTTPSQSIVFYGNSTQGYYFDHYFNTFRSTDSSGLMSVQFRAMFPQPPESALDLNHFSIYSDLVTKPIDLEFSDGIIFDVNRGVSPVGTYAFGSWNTYTLLVNLQSNTYDLYQDSNRLVNGAPITQIVTEVSKVGFWVNTNSSMYLDYVTIANGSVLVDAITTGGIISDTGVPVADLRWCWSDTNGSFDWACCTAQENATRSILCPARVTARFWLGSATTFILGNFIYFLILIIIFVIVTPYIAPKLRGQ